LFHLLRCRRDPPTVDHRMHGVEHARCACPASVNANTHQARPRCRWRRSATTPVGIAGIGGCGHEPRVPHARWGNPDRGCTTPGSSIASPPVMSRPWLSSTTGMPAPQYSLAQRICGDEHPRRGRGRERVSRAVAGPHRLAAPSGGVLHLVAVRRAPAGGGHGAPGRYRPAGPGSPPRGDHRGNPQRVLLLPHPPRSDLRWGTPSGAPSPGCLRSRPKRSFWATTGATPNARSRPSSAYPWPRYKGECSPPSTTYAVHRALSRGTSDLAGHNPNGHAASSGPGV